MTTTYQLAAVLHSQLGSVVELDAREAAADALLPTVRGIVAAELRAAADSVDDWHLSACDPVAVLRKRADALDSEEPA